MKTLSRGVTGWLRGVHVVPNPLTAQVGAAVLGVAVKPTIKEVDGEGRVTKTLVRAGLWEVQTPQVPHSGFLCVCRLPLERYTAPWCTAPCAALSAPLVVACQHSHKA